MNKASVPDAWDDDWETQADRFASKEESPPQSTPLTRQERLMQHAEANRRLWESADSTETLHHLEPNGGVPLTTTFKPQVKVLSRKPVIAKRDPVTGMSQLSIDDEDPKTHEVQLTPEEIRAKQRRDREEKQRRYEEARAKIFGESAPSSRGSSPGPGAVTPPRADGRSSGRGRGRGGAYRNNNSSSSSNNNNNNNNNNNSSNNNSNNNTVNANNSGRQLENRRSNNQPGPTRELYDPGYSPKPDSGRRGGGGNGDASTRGQPVRDEQQAIRAPRGPDGSGRGGFGFARRGARET